MIRRVVLALAAWGACLAGAACAAPAAALSGSLTCVGSDTASGLVARWAAAFHARHPKVRLQLQAPGSASAPTALVEGAADLGSMSRPMTAAEEALFRSRYGYAPWHLVVAHDAVVAFVHPDNPLARISVPELDAIYSQDRRCGAAQAIRRWRDLPGIGAGFDLPLLATGRNGGSGTYETFREGALCGGEYRADVIAWPGNGAVVATVAAHREAIGYAGIGYVNGLVKPLALAAAADSPAVLPDLDSVTQGRYPLSRALHVYVNRPPQRALAELPRAFLEYALSDEGQAEVRREGFLPLRADERATQRALLQ